MRLLEDDWMCKCRARRERDVVALTGDDLEPQAEHPADGANPRAGGENHFVSDERAAARAHCTHPIADHVEASDLATLEQGHVSRPEGADEAVDEPTGLECAIAGEHEPRSHAVREGRHHLANTLAVEHVAGAG